MDLMDRPLSIQAFEQYLRRRAPQRRTVIDYVSDVRQFAAFCGTAWREVSMHDVDGFVDQQRQAGRSPATIKRRVAALKVFFDFLAEESGDLAWPNPVRAKRHAGKQAKRLPRDLRDADVAALWAVISQPRDRAWFVLMWRAGLRVGEVVTLQLADILAPARAEQPARLRVCGKGQQERLVLLTADAYAVLLAWLQVRPPSQSPQVFLNQRGQPISANGIQGLLRNYGQQAGCAVTPHQLRHTFARQVTEAGMPITSLGKLLGHAQVSTTQIYTAGADPVLAQAYQTAMAQVPAHPEVAGEPTVALAEPGRNAARAVRPAASSASPSLPDCSMWASDWPPAIRTACLTYLQHCALRWKPVRRAVRFRNLRWRLYHFWSWQLARRPLSPLSEVSLADLRAFQAAELARGIAPHSINPQLACVVDLLRYQADQGQPVDNSVFRLRPLPRPDSLPRYLSESESQRLEAFVLSRLAIPDPVTALENACFFVLAHTGVRACECLELQAHDLDLSARRLWVRQGKGQRDRIVYLSDRACQALAHYLQSTRCAAATFLLHKADGTALTYQWLHRHLVALAETAGVPKVSPHRLRHTLATRLLNAGMAITGVQKLLGHEYLSTTQIYARVYDSTVEADYRQAMAKVEHLHLPLSDTPLPVDNWPTNGPSLPAEVPSTAYV
jgi:site-specific recombinase XerD